MPYRCLVCIVIATIVFASASNASKDGQVSTCSRGKRTLHEFKDRSLLGDRNITFSQNAGQVVIIANVASF